jgi:cupin 2 domain-containing protein
MLPVINNLLANLPSALSGEVFETITDCDALCIERIVSHGQSTPQGEWYEQERDEWVLVVTGSAELQFDDGQKTYRLDAGDYTLIPAGCRHRVCWTDPAQKTVWLAVHYTAGHTP